MSLIAKIFAPLCAKSPGTCRPFICYLAETEGGPGKQIVELKSVHITKIHLIIFENPDIAQHTKWSQVGAGQVKYGVALLHRESSLGRRNEKSKTIFTKLRGKKPEGPQRNTVICNSILPLNIVFGIFCIFFIYFQDNHTTLPFLCNTQKNLAISIISICLPDLVH